MSILFDKCLKSICPGQIQELQCHQVFSRLAVAYLDKDMQTSSIVVFKEVSGRDVTIALGWGGG